MDVKFHSVGPFTRSPPPDDIAIFESIDPVSCFGFSDGVISKHFWGHNAIHIQLDW